MERHPGPDHPGRRRPAEKAVALDEQRRCAGASRRERRRTAGVAAADDEDVVLGALRHRAHFAARFVNLYGRSRDEFGALFR